MTERAETEDKGSPQPEESRRSSVVRDALAGFVAGLYSIPEGIGYAQLAGINPMLGVYSGMAPVAAGALTTGSILMISTLTSAIALTMKGVLDGENLSSTSAVVTLTLVAGAMMFVLGVLKLGKVVNYVSNAVMTGFVMGVAVLITVGKFDDIFGYKPTGVSNKVVEAADILVHPQDWDLTTTAVGLGSIALVYLLRWFPPTRRVALVLGVVIGTAVVWIFDIDTSLISDVATIPSGLDAIPIPSGSADLPDLSLVPELLVGSLSIALVALAQGAGIRPSFPNPDGAPASSSRDFLGQGVGNLVGSLFQSTPTGGSLSRTAVSVEGGASSRAGGLFAAASLVVLVVLFAPAVGHIPEAVIGGLLFVIGVEIISGRLPDARLAVRAGRQSAVLFTFALVLALTVPLQWAILGGALLSLLDFVASAGNRVRLHECRQDETGWVVSFDDPPATVPAGGVVVLAYEGPNFFAEVPALIDEIPVPEDGGAPGVVVFDLGLLQTFSSTFIKALGKYHDKLAAAGCGLVICGVTDPGREVLDQTGMLQRLGEENVLGLEYHLGENLDIGLRRGQTLLTELGGRAARG